MKKNTSTLELIMLTLANLLYFLYVKGAIGLSNYTFICSLFSLYFFLVKLFIFKEENSIDFFSNIFIGIVVIMSIVSLYLGQSDSLKIILFICQLVNIFLLIKRYSFSEKYFIIKHILLGMLIAASFFSKSL